MQLHIYTFNLNETYKLINSICNHIIINNTSTHTFGTNISNMLRKQQKITANDINANDASCWDAITIATGAVMRHNTTTLYMLIPT